MNERIKELELIVANSMDPLKYWPSGDYTTEFNKRFAELIVKECIVLMENERDMYADPGTYESREYYERMAAKEDAFNDAASTIKYHFGVK